MRSKGPSRRKFLQQSVLAAAALTLIPRNVLGGRGFIAAGDRINLGFIGTGRLARWYFEHFTNLPGVHLLAASDVDARKLKKFKELVDGYYTRTTSNPSYSDCRTFGDYHEMLELRDLDAVVVATPDHWHALASIDSMKAGKDVYCEKPLAHTIHEGREMVKTARLLGRVVQTGSMQRSWRDFRHACELVTNGYFGEIRRVLVNVGDPAVECDLPGERIPEGLDWERWVGPAPIRPYNQVLAPPPENEEWPRWRMYREFGGGGLADWGAHMFDIAQWGLGMDDSGPVRFVPPENPEATRGLKMFYANGVEMIHEDFGRGWAVRFIGTEGRLDVSRSFLDSKPEYLAGIGIKDTDKRLYHSENHYQDWIDAIKNRTRPVADVETGHRSASVCNLANIAYRLHEELEWDPGKEKFPGNGQANRLRTRKYRKPYVL